MGWFSKILKGSTDKISKWDHYRDAERNFNHHDGYSGRNFHSNTPSCSEGHHNGNFVSNLNSNMASTSGKDSDQYTPSSSRDSWSEQNEEIDLAIALSLAEAEQGGNDAVVDKSQEEDEKLAKALQESLNIESPPECGNGTAYPLVPPHYGNGTVYPPIPPHYGSGTAYPPMPYYPMGYRICAGCQNEIGCGRYLTCMNGFWHPECFRCHACNLPITDYEFSMSGKYPYHKSCYRNNNHPKCDVCKHFIPTNLVGLIEYRVHPFWMQKYCPSHEHDGTPRCCSCEQLEPQDTKYVALKDHRKLCLECLDSAVMDTKECQPLNRNILQYYENLNMKVEQYVPLLLVEREALNEARDGEKNGHHHMPETRGLCLSETQTISTVTKRPRFGARNLAMDMITEPYALTRHCEVTAILVLYGLPRLLTGSILAHEMMHAWLRLKGYPTLRPDVEEGICQVLAHMWLESELTYAEGHPSSSNSTYKKSKRSPFEQKLGEFFKHQIESDPSPIYGDGFRAGQHAVRKYGLQSTLNHILRTGNFPY